MRFKILLTVLLVFSLAGLFSYLTAEEPPKQSNEPAKKEASAVSAPEAKENQSQPKEEEAPASEVALPTPSAAGNITIDFKEADIHNVLRILSFKSGANIVAGKEVTGTITIRLVDVPWEKALDTILKTYGFVYEREGNIIRVTTIENLSKENLQTEVYPLNYAKAKDTVDSLKEMLTERGKIKYDERTNILVVTDIPTNLYKVAQVVQRLDRKTPQVSIEAKIIETTLSNADKLGINWTIKVTATGAKRPTTAPFETLGAPSLNGQDISKFLPLPAPTTTDFPSSTIPSFPYSAKTDFTFGTLDFSQFQAVLEVLKSRSNTKIISNPTISTLDNQEAKILVGEIFNIPTYVTDTSTGRLTISGYTSRDLGIKLTVTPHVNPQGDIVVQLHPEVSSFLNWDNFGNVTAPRFSTREATTKVMIKNGQTVVIGGLIKENTVDTRYKVPLLGDIPILGYLFSKKEKTIDKTDLLFFVTTKIIGEPTEGLKEDLTASVPAKP